jgi:FixJ family two-component response regulator
MEILILVAKGKSNREIGAELAISEGTVRVHAGAAVETPLQQPGADGFRSHPPWHYRTGMMRVPRRSNAAALV